MPTDPTTTVVGPDEFRATMASICAPVTIITGLDDGGPHGTTVSAFSSLSLEPPLIMVALDRGSDLLALIRATRRFGVNVLSHRQDELALRFARKGRDTFEGVPWRAEHGVPRLEVLAGWLACTLDDVLDGGDHVIAVGRVVAAEPIPAAPLVYHQRRFGTHSEFVTGSDGDGQSA